MFQEKAQARQIQAGRWAHQILAAETAPSRGSLMYLDCIVMRHGRLPVLEFAEKVLYPAQGSEHLQQ